VLLLSHVPNTLFAQGDISTQGPQIVMQSGVTSGQLRFAFSPDGRLLAAASSQSSDVVLWDTSTGHQLRTFTTDVQLTLSTQEANVTFSPDGNLLAVCRGGIIFVWNVRTGALGKRFGTSWETMETSRVQFSADGRLLAATQGTGHIGIWSTSSGELQRMLEVGTCFDFTLADDKILVYGGPDFRTYEVASGRQLRSVKLLDVVPSNMASGRILARRADGRIFLATHQGHFALWDLTTSKASRMWQSGSGNSADPADPWQSFVLSADASYGAILDPTTVFIWDLASQKHIASIPAFPTNAEFKGADASFAEFSPDHRKIVIGDSHGDVRLVEIPSGGEVIHLGREVSGRSNIHFATDGKSLFVGGAVWDLAAGTARSISPVRNIAGEIMSSDGNHYAALSAVDSSIQIWSVSNRSLVRTVSIPARVRPGGVSISPDGKFLAATYFPTDIQNYMTNLNRDEPEEVPEDVTPTEQSIGGGRFRRGSGKAAKEQLREIQQAMKSGNFDQVMKSRSPSIGQMATPQIVKTPADDYAHRVFIWDIDTGQQLKNVECPAGDKSATVCFVFFSGTGESLALVSPSGMTRILKVGSWDEVASGTLLQQVQVNDGEQGSTSVTSAEFSPDGHLFAGALMQNSVSMPSLASLYEQQAAMLKYGSKKRLAYFGLPRESSKPAPDVTSSMKWNYSGPISILDTQTGKQVLTLTGHSDGSASVAFSPDGKHLASASESGEVKLWDLATRREVYSTHQKSSGIQSLSFNADGSILASFSADGSADLWDAEDGSHIATLVSTNDGKDWLVFTPDGLFDGSPSAWRDILWRFGGDTFDVAPIEMFFNEYYSPGLLAEIMSGKRPHADSRIEDKDRRTPQLSIERMNESGADAVSTNKLPLKIQVRDAPAGAQDLRLFRNGTLVEEWKGDVLQGKPLATIETTVRIAAGENHLTAYAFNSSNIKSQDASLTVVGAETIRRKGNLFVVAVGVNNYSNPAYNLKFASADAQAFAEAVDKNAKSTASFDEVSVTTIVDSQATRENILSALHGIAAKAQPEDAVSIFLASHGAAFAGHFYLVPHDIGYDGSPADLNPDAWKAILSHTISDQDLENAFQDMDTGRILLVLDACNSGQALEAEGKRVGPINSRGLAQLAYEKGMYVLAASQSYQAALEASELGHGLLTHSLVSEGLNERKADFEPKDGKIVVEEWLDYAAKRVPEIQSERMQQARSLESSRSMEDPRKSGQQPRLFSPRTTEARDWIIAGP
jgi:WD40 repeat protein